MLSETSRPLATTNLLRPTDTGRCVDGVTEKGYRGRFALVNGGRSAWVRQQRFMVVISATAQAGGAALVFATGVGHVCLLGPNCAVRPVGVNRPACSTCLTSVSF